MQPRRVYSVLNRLRIHLRAALSRISPASRLLDPYGFTTGLHRLTRRLRVGRARRMFDRYAQTHNPVKLHIGCNGRVIKGWLNVDWEYTPAFHEWRDSYPAEERGDPVTEFTLVDVVVDGLPFPDSSVDLIYHEDFIEHLPQREAVRFLAEAHRILKPGGVQRIVTPDLVWSMKNRSDMTRGGPGVNVAEWDDWDHLNVLGPRYLEELCDIIGYSRIERRARDQTQHAFPPDTRPGEDRPNEGNLYFEVYK